jgi:predicted DNA-binding protein
MTKTMSIRLDRENYEFLNELTKEQRSDLSKTVRDLVTPWQGFTRRRAL